MPKTNIYQHRYGGFYLKIGVALDTQTSQEVVIYKHLWPFEPKLFTRPLDQFNDPLRFKKVTFQKFKQASSTDRLVFQKAIEENKLNKTAIIGF